MPIEILQRLAWNGEPKELGDLFRIQKKRGYARVRSTRNQSVGIRSASPAGFAAARQDYRPLPEPTVVVVDASSAPATALY
jgi:hypothetical protein